MNEWIPVKERMPDPNTAVLVCYEGTEQEDDGRFVGIGKLYPERDQQWAVTSGPADWFWTEASSIPCWQPLLDLPTAPGG